MSQSLQTAVKILVVDDETDMVAPCKIREVGI